MRVMRCSVTLSMGYHFDPTLAMWAGHNAKVGARRIGAARFSHAKKVFGRIPVHFAHDHLEVPVFKRRDDALPVDLIIGGVFDRLKRNDDLGSI